MPPLSLDAETRWLETVLQTLSDAGRPTSLVAVERLRDRLMLLAWNEGAPRANSFQSADAQEQFRRHPIASIDSTGCSALLMYWPPGHATLPHDHDGLWGIELVIDGTLAVNEFVRVDAGEYSPLAATNTLHLGIGDAVVFDGARYVHRCRNLSNAHPTLTLHVYGGELKTYTAWQKDEAGRLRAGRVVARVDSSLS